MQTAAGVRPAYIGCAAGGTVMCNSFCGYCLDLRVRIAYNNSMNRLRKPHSAKSYILIFYEKDPEKILGILVCLFPEEFRQRAALCKHIL